MFYDKIISDNWSLALSYAHANGGQHSTFGFFLLVLFTFVGVSGWLAATFFIIMSMETLSAFLHALRLHWYESEWNRMKKKGREKGN